MLDYFKEYFDFKLVIMVAVLITIGLLSIFSATYDAGTTFSFQKQLIWLGIGTVAFFVTAFIPLKTIQRFSIPIYVIMMVALLVVLVIGKTVSGAKSWVGIAGLGIQPSEMAKIATVLAIAAYLSRSTVSISENKHFLMTIFIIVCPMILILGQPDMGTALVFLGILFPILFWSGVSNFVLLAIISPLITAMGALIGTVPFLISIAICGVMLYYTRENKFIAVVAFTLAIAVGVSVQTVYERLPGYQQKRIATFLNPEKDKLGAGYNVEQAKVAIGSGGFFGKGYLKGTQTQLNFIPEQWTDFIFCVPAEEFGMMGAATVILLFGALLMHCLNLASKCTGRFGSLIAIGIAGIFVTHFSINIGMALGIMPVIGIPLPFLSYGGSALLANMTMAGLLMNVYANRKEY
jgi:rod shape determining protein RodA